jgi:hypothetical protein
MAENILVGAAGVFQGIGQYRQPIEGFLFVDCLASCLTVVVNQRLSKLM